ncbi:hypothetical protein N4R57_14560 [Rhodobacteraceae bacterium D3-12]|nr:hypothetical protein N4R57_14560 [Rhodobacteraceae bacterium D3-12]
MPLSILLPLVVVGIGGITILLHLLDLSRPLHFADEQAARAAWEREFPDIPATGAILCKTRTAALIETRDGPGVVWAMGVDSAARALDGARAARKPKGLMLYLPDFTAPKLFLALDQDEADLWLSRLPPSQDRDQNRDQETTHA